VSAAATVHLLASLYLHLLLLFFIHPRPPTSTLFPYTTLFRSPPPRRTPPSRRRTRSMETPAHVGPVHSPIHSGSALTSASRPPRSEEHTSELQSRENLVCRLLLEKKKTRTKHYDCPSIAALST